MFFVRGPPRLPPPPPPSHGRLAPHRRPGSETAGRGVRRRPLSPRGTTRRLTPSLLAQAAGVYAAVLSADVAVWNPVRPPPPLPPFSLSPLCLQSPPPLSSPFSPPFIPPFPHSQPIHLAYGPLPSPPPIPSSSTPSPRRTVKGKASTRVLARLAPPFSLHPLPPHFLQLNHPPFTPPFLFFA